MEPTETDILAVARAMGDAIPIELPTQPLPESDAVKEPPTAKVRTLTAEQPTEWEEIRPRIEHRISTQPRELQRQIGPSELGTRCVHCLAAKLAGWPEQPAGLAAFRGHLRARHVREMVRRHGRHGDGLAGG